MNPLCALRQRTLARYAALKAPPPADSPLAHHLARCDRCRAAWNDLRRLTDDLPRTLTAPTLSASFDANLQGRLASAARSERLLEPQIHADERRWGRADGPRRLALAAAVLVVTAISAVVFVRPPHQSSVSQRVGRENERKTAGVPRLRGMREKAARARHSPLLAIHSAHAPGNPRDPSPMSAHPRLSAVSYSGCS